MDPQKSPAASSLETGLEGAASTTVTRSMTGRAMGSGKVDVYATPSMVALMEAAAVDCVERLLPPGQISLGIHLETSHTAATPVGDHVSAKATLVAIEGRKLTFKVEARDSTELIGEAKHTRVVIDSERFMAKLASKRPRA